MISTGTEALRQITAALATLLDAPAMLALCREGGSQWRARLLDPVTTVPLFLLHILHGNTAWSHLPRLVAHPWTAAALCHARTRVPLGVWQRLRRRTAAVCEQTTHDEGRWRGHRTCLVDGSSFAMPDTPELQEDWGHPRGQRPGGGGPVAHRLALLHAGTGFRLETLAAPWHPHDMAEVAMLHATLRPGEVLVGERAFCSWAPLARLRQQGLHAVCRVPQRHMVDGTPSRPPTASKPPATQKGWPRSRWLRQLGVTAHRVAWVQPVRLPVHPPVWRTPELFAALPAVLCVRAGRDRVAQAGFRTPMVPVVTPLLEVDLSPADTLAEWYHVRWQVETHLRHRKQTMGLEVRHCQRLVGSLKELAVFARVSNVVRLVMLAAATRQRVALERLRCVDALRWLSTARPGAPLPPVVVHPHRPNRVEPRAVKRRPKPYPLLTKPRREARNALIQQAVGA